MAEACYTCRGEFGLTTWKHGCWICGKVFCSKHFLEIPHAEARRRFDKSIELRSAVDGDGLCPTCDRNRTTTVRWRGERELKMGEQIWFTEAELDLPKGCTFRFAATYTAEKKVVAVLVPGNGYRSRLLLAFRDEAGRLDAVLHSDTPAVLSQMAPKVVVPKEVQNMPEWRNASAQSRATAEGAFALAALEEALLALWLPADLDRCVAFGVRAARDGGLGSIRTRAAIAIAFADVAPLSTAGTSALLAAGVQGASAGLGVVALRVASSAVAPWLAAAIFGAGMLAAAALADDEPIQDFRKTVLAAADKLDLAEFQRILSAAADMLYIARARGLDRSKPADAMTADFRESTALTCRWLAENKSGALRDAANLRHPNPWAVVIFGLAERNHAQLTALLQGTKIGAATSSFPWHQMFSRLMNQVVQPNHWSQGRLGALTIGQRLGGGAVKDVYALADRPANVLCLAKSEERCRYSMLHEVDVLQAVALGFGDLGAHLGVPKVLACGQIESSGKKTLGYVTERCEPFSESRRSRLSSTTAWVRAARDVAGALERLHHIGYAHGDVKAANLLFAADGTVMLGDFGAAAMLGADGMAPSAEWSPDFGAPEQRERAVVCRASDVFSLARTLEHELRTVDNAPKRDDATPRNRTLWQIIDKCQEPVMSARPNARELGKQLDEWLTATSDPAPTRLATVDSEASVAILRASQTWREQPTAHSQQRLVAAARELRVARLAPGTSGLHQAARHWLDAAKVLTVDQFMRPWASATPDRETLLIGLAAQHERGSREARSAINDLVRALRGDVPDLSLSRVGAFLLWDDYRAVAGSLNRWLKQCACAVDTAKIGKRCDDLGQLRNAMEHRAGDKPALAYGRVVDGQLRLADSDLSRLELDILELIGWLHGGPNRRAS